MNIIYQDNYFFAIDKPSGYFVHPPELSPYPVPKEKICIYVLRQLLKKDVFPVHRLDAPTSGVLLFTTSKFATQKLSHLFMERQMKKTYHAVVRGYTPAEGKIEIPLEINEGQSTVEACTSYRTLATIELPFAVGKKYPTARYSLVEVEPLTGRWHQIRRHFDRVAHPLLGDIEHGDSHHNRFFRDELKITGLCLKALSIEFVHPWTEQNIKIETPRCEKWEQIYKLFKYAHPG